MNKPLYQMMSEVRQLNETHGWFDRSRSFGEDIALLHSEVSEALEAWRASKNVTTRLRYDGKPEGVGSELADVLIRLLDTCSRYKINLEEEFNTKMRYNVGREYRHGNKAL